MYNPPGSKDQEIHDKLHDIYLKIQTNRLTRPERNRIVEAYENVQPQKPKNNWIIAIFCKRTIIN